MAHPFQDKLVAFIGAPQRCTRQAARDALIAAGGIPEGRIGVFVRYVVAFDGAETTKAYEKAKNYRGLMSILSEDQFFDILEGKAAPPELPKNKSEKGFVSYPINPEAEARRNERVIDLVVTKKRIEAMAKYGVPTPDGGRIKADLRPLDTAARVVKIMGDEANRRENPISVSRETFSIKPMIQRAYIQGVAVYNTEPITVNDRPNGEYWAEVKDLKHKHVVILTFTRDGRDLESHLCGCVPSRRGNLICKHVVAAVLKIQGGPVHTTETTDI
jgi:hypothetical protein